MQRLIELDGLRGLACLMVLVAHYFGEVPHGLGWLLGGWVGVSLFFCLSGFLIGGILIDSRDSPTFFSSFYIRRSFRIFPVYYLVVCAVIAAVVLTKDSGWTDPALPPAVYFTYTQNIALSVTGDQRSLWLLPTWTLALEEQFYILLPLLIGHVSRRHLVKFILALVLSATLFRLTLFLTHAEHVAVLVTRWDMLLMGVLAAIGYRQIWPRLIERNARLLQIAAVGGVILTLALAVIGKFDNNTSFEILGPLTAAVGCTGYMLFVISEGKRFHSKWLRYIGSISYGLYLIHQPINGLLHGVILGTRPDVETLSQIGVTVTAMTLSMLLAGLSWRLFERPLVGYGHQLSERRMARLRPGII